VVHTKTGKFNAESHCKEGVKKESRELVVARTSHGLLVAWKAAAARLYAFLSPSLELAREGTDKVRKRSKERQRLISHYHHPSMRKKLPPLSRSEVAKHHQ
jgi:hypothetical protein